MDIKGKAYCLFEQSGTFKREFIKLGIPAEDFDIQDNFGETDHVVDLFDAIEKAYNGEASLFDQITPDDFILAFFPCTHFCGVSQMWFNMSMWNYAKWSTRAIIENVLKKNRERAAYFDLLNKFVCVCLERGLRMVFENPTQGQSVLRVFLKQPDVVDENRMLRGDYMIKPTGYWFWNCTPTNGFTYQYDKKRVEPMLLKSGKGGLCSEERSMISPDYARNFICDFILGRAQPEINPTLFD